MSKEDWRTTDAYDYLADLDTAGVAFEFLRRNPDYQADCRQIVSQDALSADDEAKSVGLARRWGLAFPADPQIRADEQTVFWLPDVLVSTVVLVALNGRWDGPSRATIGWQDKSGSPVAIQAIDMACLSPCRMVGSRAAPRQNANDSNDVSGTVRPFHPSDWRR